MYRYEIKWTKIDDPNRSIEGVLSRAEYMKVPIEIAIVKRDKGSVGISREEYMDVDVDITESDTEKIMEMIKHFYCGVFDEDPYIWIKDEEDILEDKRYKEAIENYHRKLS